ncbi:hypothetical protein SLEP1_g39030 [Rubroshorea leprosula]|uniref:C2H2-type domain-containing protein n=1 Tax=Rubroshorea leprosula TaxID=152421 RepID=A0AAV5KZ55_9ROSI|nr:hypothetical protein SLEP1_g39030 [Rubroshorea leprosula]
MPILCRHCNGRLMDSLVDIRNHNKKAHARMRFECNVCFNAFLSVEDLENHQE